MAPKFRNRRTLHWASNVWMMTSSEGALREMVTGLPPLFPVPPRTGPIGGRKFGIDLGPNAILVRP